MTSIFMLIGCLLSFEEYESLQKELLDTATPEEPPESPRYIYLGEEDCIHLSRNIDPFLSPPWSFSFRVTKERIKEDRVYSLFATDSHSILMKYSNEGEAENSSYIEITVCLHQQGVESICDQTNLVRPVPTSFEEGDRITISVSAENAGGFSSIRVYQQYTVIGEIEDFRAPYMTLSESVLTFGCPVDDLTDIIGSSINNENIDVMGGWEAGVDSLILLDKKLGDLQMQSMIEAEEDNRLLNFLENPFNEDIDISYWNLGEDIQPDVNDSIGDRDGKVQGEGYIFQNHD